jgi:hypothetical protein
MEIVFTDLVTEGNTFPKPQPAIKVLPEWYKNLQHYFPDNKKIPNLNGSNNGTVKRCMPVFDVMTAGYILFTPVDVYVRTEDSHPVFTWAGYNSIDFHPIEQTVGHPAKKIHEATPKWINPWGIKTPKGYSTLFLPPQHRDSVFTILSGMVDTDGYTRPVNFPFVLTDPNWEGMIPAGTPMVQVIPFKRQTYKMKLGGKKEFKDAINNQNKMNTVFFDRYKKFWWQRKEYK